jgi:broad specificity phosphatase PhoE
MRIIITRHGETEQNKAKILQGQIQGDLSELGKEQAKKLANRLKEEKIDCIFSSDLRRALDTASEIRKYHNQIPFEVVEDLRELNMGSLQGKPAPEGWKEKRWEKGFLKGKNGEENEELLNRAKNFINNITSKFENETVLLVAHNGINRALISILLEKNLEEMRELESLKNTSITIFEFNEEGKALLKLMNCIKHLEE